jgi:hypothetical protein
MSAKNHVLPLMVLLLALAAGAAEFKQYLLKLSADDTFTVAETKTWAVKVERFMLLRHADVKVTPKTGAAFNLLLAFKCDTPDLGNFDSAGKMKQAVVQSAQKHLADCVEQTVQLHPVNHRGRYGFYTVQTDASLANASQVPEGKFKFTTRGMVRLSTDSALGFTLQTNEVTSKEYQELLGYVLSFIQPAS